MDNVAQPRAALYPRCSKDRRHDEASVDEQLEDGHADCEAHSWAPFVYGGDNDRSASRYARNPTRDDWEQLRADVRDGKRDIVWLWESSRGDRKAYEWLGFLEDCRDHRVTIYVSSSRRMYDMTVPADWRALASEGIDNAYASDLTSQRIKRHLKRTAARGKPHGEVQWGYERRYDPATREYLTQDPVHPAASIAGEIITRISEHHPVKAIKDDLDTRGARPPRAPYGPLPQYPWSRATIRKIALNPAYAGCRRLPDGTFVEGWPGIVTLETHLAAVAVLSDAGRSPRPGRQEHLLTYLAQCKDCGRDLSSRASKQRYTCNHGHVYVDEQWLDELITGLVCAALAEDDAAQVWQADGKEAARLRADAAALRRQLDDWAAAAITPRAYQIKEAQLLPEIERAEQAAEAAAVPVPLQGLVGAADVRAAWDELDVPARRAVIRALMSIQVTRAASCAHALRRDPSRVLVTWKR